MFLGTVCAALRMWARNETSVYQIRTNMASTAVEAQDKPKYFAEF